MTAANQLAGYASSLPSMKNLVINGDMRIAQRGTSFTSSGVTYGLDRFAHYSSSPVSNNIQQSTDVPSNQGFDYSIKLNTVDLRHSVELPAAGKQGVFATGKVFTLSFWGKTGSSTKSTTINLVFNNGSAYTDSTSPFTSTNNTVTLTTTWQRFEIQYTIDQVPTGNHVACTFGIDANANINYFTGFQLEEGTVATPFEHRPIGVELSLCQRYYYKLGAGTKWGSQGSGSGFQIKFYMEPARHPVQMRASPTLSLVSGGSAYFSAYAGVSPTVLSGDLGTVNTSSMSFSGIENVNEFGVNRLGIDGAGHSQGAGYGSLNNFINCSAEL